MQEKIIVKDSNRAKRYSDIPCNPEMEEYLLGAVLE